MFRLDIFPVLYVSLSSYILDAMKITDELIDKVLDRGENGTLDATPYMDNLKFLLADDEEVDLTEDDHAHLVFLGAVCMECLKETGQYKNIEDEEALYDLEDANYEALEKSDGDLDAFLDALSEDFPEQTLLEFLAFAILPVDPEDDDDDDEEEEAMSSEDAQILGFIRLKSIVDAVLLPSLSGE